MRQSQWVAFSGTGRKLREADQAPFTLPSTPPLAVPGDPGGVPQGLNLAEAPSEPQRHLHRSATLNSDASSVPPAQPHSPLVSEVINAELGTEEAVRMSEPVEKMIHVVHSLLLQNQRRQKELDGDNVHTRTGSTFPTLLDRQRKLEEWVEGATVLMSGLQATTAESSPMTEDWAYNLFRVVGTQFKELQADEPDDASAPATASAPADAPTSTVKAKATAKAKGKAKAVPRFIVDSDTAESDSPSTPPGTQEYELDGSPKLDLGSLRVDSSPGAPVAPVTPPATRRRSASPQVGRLRLKRRIVGKRWPGKDLD